MATNVQIPRPTNSSNVAQNAEAARARFAFEKIQTAIREIGKPDQRVEAAKKGQHLPLLAYDFGNPKVLDIIVKRIDTPQRAIDRIGKMVVAMADNNFDKYAPLASTIIVQRRSSDEVRLRLSQKFNAFKERTAPKIHNRGFMGNFLRPDVESLVQQPKLQEIN